MKKLLGIVVLGLLISTSVQAKNRPTLECVFNDKDRTTVIYDLNKYGENLEVDDQEYFWSTDVIENGMKSIIMITIKRKSGMAELKVSKPFPVESDIAVVFDAMDKGEMTTGKCKKLDDQNL